MIVPTTSKPSAPSSDVSYAVSAAASCSALTLPSHLQEKALALLPQDVTKFSFSDAVYSARYRACIKASGQSTWKDTHVTSCARSAR